MAKTEFKSIKTIVRFSAIHLVFISVPIDCKSEYRRAVGTYCHVRAQKTSPFATCERALLTCLLSDAMDRLFISGLTMHHLFVLFHRFLSVLVNLFDQLGSFGGDKRDHDASIRFKLFDIGTRFLEATVRSAEAA